MFTAIVLSHLPKRFANKLRVDAVKNLNHAPDFNTTVEILESSGFEKSDVLGTLAHMQTQAESTVRELEKRKIHFVDYWNEEFPHRLKSLENCPWGIYYYGKLPSKFAPTLSVVGTRNPNRYGCEVMSRILGALSTNCFEHVSGLAYGIDSIAHHITLKLGVRNFAVLGSGIDKLYPTEHADLATRIIDAGGGILSEFPPGTPAESWHFPWRNRIIAALADAVWIPQGSKKSGSAHTAVWAESLGRQILTTPGDIFSELSYLPHELIADIEKIKIVTKAQDLENFLGLGLRV